MTIALEDIASLALAVGKRTQISDPAARALITTTRDMRKRAAVEDAQRSAESVLDYTPEQLAAIKTLQTVYWPRARAVRDAMRTADATSRIAFRDHDADAVYTSVLRAHRLSVLSALIGRASARVGAFPLSHNDMSLTRSRFVRTAFKRHFTFNGGRDVGSRDMSAQDILQGAFIRAIESGDTVNGVPTFGTMFRHVQAERAHLTRIANAEYAGMRNAAFGNTSREEAWPEMTDKHSMRLLGTRKYASVSQHRESLAIAHVDAERASIDDTIAAQARQDALASYDDTTEFHAILARVLISGATLEDVSAQLGLTVQTIKDQAIASKLASVRIIDSGIDHSQRSADLIRMDEREHEIDTAQAEHAERLRGVHVAAEAVHYAISRTGDVESTPATDDDYMERGQRVIESWNRDNTRDLTGSIFHAGISERQYFDGNAWHYAPDVIRVHAFYAVESAA